MVYRSKFDWIGRFLSPDASVLDLGCVCHDLDQTAVPWLHQFLVERAGRVVGVDILPEAVERMKREGYQAVCADAETLNLGETFDVVVAGDILEHLDNPGEFLDHAARHLASNGVLLLTTPNPVTYVRLLRVLFKGHAGANKEHTCWFTAKVLRQLAERHGLGVAEEAFVDDTRLFYPWWKPVSRGSAVRRFFRRVNRLLGMLLIWKPAVWFQSLLCRLRPRLAETLCLALRKVE
ncbi:MAG: class I SAM-dependent methyltransferase [Phycisphaerae bacterium]|nr:class I SAM-dependent methyltransferase [Phycisphaerae bacterium]